MERCLYIKMVIPHSNIFTHVLSFGTKKAQDLYYTISCAFKLIFHIYYANCITSASIFFNSSKDNVGTQSAISSSDIFPFLSVFQPLLAFSYERKCFPYPSKYVFIICSLSNKLIIIVTTSTSSIIRYSFKMF